MSLHDDEEDPVVLWAEVHRLRAALDGPTGFATWHDAAVSERVRRVKADTEITRLRAALTELVALKDLKERMELWMRDDKTGEQRPALPLTERKAATINYHRRKPLAWAAASAALAPCIGRDPACPCQDGDGCHYKDAADGTKAWPLPQETP